MKKEHGNKKYGMVIDLDKCTGCGSCMAACMSENNVPFKENETNKLDSITWMRVYKLTNGEEFPKTDVCYIPRPCMQCAGKHEGHSPCVSVCPAVATDYDMTTGIVSQIYTRCFGCRYCMAACPYHARYFNWWDPVWPEGVEKSLSSDVSPRMRGVVEKCSFCFHRYQRAMNLAHLEGKRELEEGEYQTSCTQACPSGAITFGDLNNHDHEVYKLAEPDYHDEHHPGIPKAKDAFRLLERLKTNPKVYYVTSREWVKKKIDFEFKHENEEEKKSGGDH